MTEGSGRTPLSWGARRFLASLEPLPHPVQNPALVILVGPPGAGKTQFALLLREQVPVAIVTTDDIRKLLFRHPRYADWEHARVFGVAYSVTQDLLRQRIPTVFDATNLYESLRARLYGIARTASARIVVVSFETPPETVRRRLERRFAEPATWDRSDATWEVYLRMAGEAEPVRRPHFVVDMTEDPTPAVSEVAACIRAG